MERDKSGITLKMEELDNEDNEELFKSGCYFYFSILLNGKTIGDITGFADSEYASLEIIKIDKEHQRKGYGTKALNQFIDLCKNFNLKYIDADCKNELIPFYKGFGADFKPRNKEDKEYLNNKFYIDL